MKILIIKSCADCPLAFMRCNGQIVGDFEEPRCNHPQHQNVALAKENEGFPDVIPVDCPLKREGLELKLKKLNVF